MLDGSRPMWDQPAGGISDTSSSEEDFETPCPPPRPLVPCLTGDSELLAIWDLLMRPDGMSVRRLFNCYRALHGQPSGSWFFWLEDCPYFELFTPHRRPLPPFRASTPGVIYSDLARHVNVEIVRLDRPSALADPFLSGGDTAAACLELFAYGGAAASLAARFSLQLREEYLGPDADVARSRELRRLAAFIADGASVHLVCDDSSRHAFVVATVLDALVQRHLVERPSCMRGGHSLSTYSFGARESVSRARTLPGFGMAAPSPSAVPPSWRHLHVRRLDPPLHCWLELDSTPTSRLAVALAAQSSCGDAAVDAVAVVRQYQPLAFAGAVAVEPVAVLQPPEAFSHRRLEPRPDAETLLMPHVVANVPPVLPHELEPPPDPPDDLVAFRVEEVIPRQQLRLFRRWARRMDSSLLLAAQGKFKAAKRAAPADLYIDARQHTSAPFRGCTMDFTSYPYRPILPSRWPDRPPCTDLSIRNIRREFRAHPTYPDRRLRGALSHGNPEVGELARVSYFAAPHGSSLQQFEAWSKQMQKEVTNGWGRTGFHGSYGLASWPQRCQPTSMVYRKESWRLCHDMSWPQSDPLVQSPNDADVDVMLIAFMLLRQFASSIGIFCSSGLPVKVWKGDLSKAYKRTGEQSANMWRRTCYGPQRSQTLDVICFGQRDGPASFTRQTDFMVHVITVELEYADACYPPIDPAVVAFLRARLDAATRLSVNQSDVHSWLRLSWVMAMIDDFGGVSVDDVLHRVDGSAVLDEQGEARRRSWLHFEVFQSVVLRFGHRLEPSDPLKFAAPTHFMGLLGGGVDVLAEELVLDQDKRVRYAALLSEALCCVALSVKELTSLAFKMLVVCEMCPFARQWLHPVFRALRGNRVAPISLVSETEVKDALQRFLDLLQGSQRIAVPMACRETFPFASMNTLLVVFADASGEDPDIGPGVSALPSSQPGYGAWTVRGSQLFIIHGLWSADEVRALSISVLEFVITWWAMVLFADTFHGVTHVLEFTDNSGAEWSARRETPSAELMQRVATRRSADLHSRDVFARTCRVSSSSNVWADHLSRQRLSPVLAEASALGLSVSHLHLPAELRDLSWLIASRA